MNKNDLIKIVATKTGLKKVDAANAIEETLNTIMESLTQGEKVQLVGFGSFEVKNRPARTGRNPRTGEPTEVAASSTPVFKAGKILKNTVNNK